MSSSRSLSNLKEAMRSLRPAVAGVALTTALLASPSQEARAQGVEEYDQLPAASQVEVAGMTELSIEDARQTLNTDPTDEDRVEAYRRCGLDEDGFFAPGTEPDSLLAPAHIQCGLEELWEDSNPFADDITERQEQAAYLVELDGQLKLIRAEGTECRATYRADEVPDDAEMKAFIHTHPLGRGEQVPQNSECRQYYSTSLRGSYGVSEMDKKFARSAPFPSFVIEEASVFRVPAMYKSPVRQEPAEITSTSRDLR